MDPFVWLDRQLPFGVGLGVGVPVAPRGGAPDPLADLAGAERAAAAAFGGPRRAEWRAGRLALRAALARLGAGCPGPLLAGPRGAPLLPDGVAGSLSHKVAEGVAWALAVVAPAADGSLGVDLELPGRAPADVLVLSLAEAAAKALDPRLGRLPAADELRVLPAADGTAELQWRVPAPALPTVQLRWLHLADRLVTLARIPWPPEAPRGS